MNPLNDIQETNAFLLAAEKKDYSEISYEKTQSLCKLKPLFKAQYHGTEEYRIFKRSLHLLRLAKLPFRAVEIVKGCLKRGEAVPDSLKCCAPSTQPQAKSERKAYLVALEQRIASPPNNPEGIAFLERINWAHGTNSALLPMLSATDYTMLPTGTLLNEGLAPMGGELDKGGMKHNGVNQKSISTETVRNLNRSWNYASETSNSFQPETYSDPESLFSAILAQLEKLSPNDEDWDQLIIKLNRLKQWNPEAFIALVKKYDSQIAQVKKLTLSRCARKRNARP